MPSEILDAFLIFQKGSNLALRTMMPALLGTDVARMHGRDDAHLPVDWDFSADNIDWVFLPCCVLPPPLLPRRSRQKLRSKSRFRLHERGSVTAFARDPHIRAFFLSSARRNLPLCQHCR